MLQVTRASASLSRMIHLYHRATDNIYVNTSLIICNESLLSKLIWLTDDVYVRTGVFTTLGNCFLHQANRIYSTN